MASTPWSEHPKVAALRKRSRTVDVAVDAVDGYERHRTWMKAALLSHYGFLSIFPLLLAATTVLGLVLKNRPDLQTEIIDSALAELPIIGQQISIDPSALGGSIPVLIIGLLITMWSALKAFASRQV